MKNLFKALGILFLILSFSCNNSNTYNAKLNENKEDSISVYKDEAYVYKCYDSINNTVVYVDLLDVGYVGFHSNKITTYYKVDHYSLTTKDSLWRWDSTIVYFIKNMPLDSMKFNRDESYIIVYSHEEDGFPIPNKLYVDTYLKGLKESMYIHKRNKNAIIRVGETKTPSYINYKPLKK